jgi:hypothetical protein
MIVLNVNKEKNCTYPTYGTDKHVIAVVFAIAQCAMGAAGSKTLNRETSTARLPKLPQV